MEFISFEYHNFLHTVLAGLHSLLSRHVRTSVLETQTHKIILKNSKPHTLRLLNSLRCLKRRAGAEQRGSDTKQNKTGTTPLHTDMPKAHVGPCATKLLSLHTYICHYLTQGPSNFPWSFFAIVITGSHLLAMIFLWNYEHVIKDGLLVKRFIFSIAL